MPMFNQAYLAIASQWSLTFEVRKRGPHHTSCRAAPTSRNGA